MTSAFEPILNEMLAEIQKQRDEMIRLHQEMPEINGSARSKRRQVSVTVDARGEIVELKFHGTGYRALAPAELADIIVQTIRDARGEANRRMREVIGDSYPEGLEFVDLADGDHDWSDLLAPPKAFMDLLKPPSAPVRPVPEGLDRVPVIDDSGSARGDQQRGG